MPSNSSELFEALIDKKINQVEILEAHRFDEVKGIILIMEDGTKIVLTGTTGCPNDSSEANIEFCISEGG